MHDYDLMERDCDTLSHTLSHSMTHDSVTHNVTYNSDLWDGDHHALSLSEYSRHLETDTKMLTTLLRYLACFVKQHPLEGHSIEQFPTILGVSSYVWNLLQAVSEAG